MRTSPTPDVQRVLLASSTVSVLRLPSAASAAVHAGLRSQQQRQHYELLAREKAEVYCHYILHSRV
jgi:hypothetical protein